MVVGNKIRLYFLCNVRSYNKKYLINFYSLINEVCFNLSISISINNNNNNKIHIITKKKSQMSQYNSKLLFSKMISLGSHQLKELLYL